MTTTIGIITIALAVVVLMGLLVNVYRFIEAADEPPKPRARGKARARTVVTFVVVQLLTISIITAAGITLLRVG